MRVTVVIPCYNVADLVGRALDSALMQDHADLEVIVVDDGSTDGTVEVLERHPAVSGGRVRLVRQMNRGASAARNHGLRMATRTYIQFLDADDMLLPGKVSGQIALAERDGWPEVIIGDYRAGRPDGLMDRVQALRWAPSCCGPPRRRPPGGWRAPTSPSPRAASWRGADTSRRRWRRSRSARDFQSATRSGRSRWAGPRGS